MNSKIILIACGLFVTGLANAECPASLDKNELAKCQTIEKTGANYQEWQQNQKEMAKKEKTSPITGEDVTTIAPAAGKVESDSAE